jgi:peptide/nickel transport system ATP-binding protein
VVSYIPQDPAVALNPSLSIGIQLRELTDAHESGWDANEVRDRIRQALAEVELPTEDEFLQRFPHQLSGGQQQRVAIAMAFLLRPKLIVLDEPTTGLDVTTQARVLDTIRDLCTDHGVSALYVTHDLAVVATLADRVFVMYAGRLAELGPTEAIFQHPAHPYTQALMAAVPDIGRRVDLHPIGGHAPRPGMRPSGCFFHPRCPHRVPACTHDPIETVELAPGHLARCIRAREQLSPPRQISPDGAGLQDGAAQALLSATGLSAAYGRRTVLHDIELTLYRGECLAIVGESGSGKTTLSRCLVGLHEDQSGTLTFDGQRLSPVARRRSMDLRRSIQYIFQSPHGALNPRRRIDDMLMQPARFFFNASQAEARTRVTSALERVELPPTIMANYPAELSGGERQRVAIARALICEPVIMICDEITSALDVSVQASIVELLRSLQAQASVSLVFVTHNLPLVRTIADRILVMHAGRIVESGETGPVVNAPKHDYTRTLIRDTPSIEQVKARPA